MQLPASATLPKREDIHALREIVNMNTDYKRTYGQADKVKAVIWSGMTGASQEAAMGAAEYGFEVGTGISGGLTMFTVAGYAASVAGIGAALASWIAAAQVAKSADGIFSFHDLKSLATGEASGRYTCSCGKCAAGIQYVIDKKEWRVGHIALGVATVGAWSLGKAAQSMAKSRMKNRPKEQNARQFIESARGGCDTAMAAIMMMVNGGEWSGSLSPKKVDKIMVNVVTCLIADNGWELLKSKW